MPRAKVSACRRVRVPAAIATRPGRMFSPAARTRALLNISRTNITGKRTTSRMRWPAEDSVVALIACTGLVGQSLRPL